MSSDQSEEHKPAPNRPVQGPVDPFPVTSHLDELADELRTVAGLRSRSAIRDRVFPTLSALLPEDSRDDPERRYAALQQLIEAGLAAMPAGDHRKAATALLAYDNGRWRPLTKRGAEAAAAFGLGWDAYRRRRDSTGSSLVVETMTELAGVLIGQTDPDPVSTPPTTAADPSVAPVHLGGDPSEQTNAKPTVPASTTKAAPRRRAAAMTALALAVIALVAGGYLYWSRTTDEPVNCGNLTNAPGDHADGVDEVDEEISRWSESFASMGRRLPDHGDACAGMMSKRDGVVYQEVSSGISGGVSAIVVAVDGSGEVVVLDHLEFLQYRAEAWDPDRPAPGIGLPVRRVDQDGGPRVVEFTNGVLVQEQADLPAVAVIGEFWTRWLEEDGFTGALGAPVSNVYDRPGTDRIQEFFDGNLVVDYGSGAISVAEHTPDDVALPDGYAGAVLVSIGTNTAWFVGDDGVRHWLPTSNDYGCVKLFHKAVELTGVPHAAIARLKAGEPMRCR